MRKSFEQRTREALGWPLIAGRVQTLQVNMGFLCNMACGHCHVDAGPARQELMGKEIVDQTLAVLKKCDIRTIDITGGAPELNPHFTYLIIEAKKAGCHVMVRSNLTVLFEKGLEHLLQFYSGHNVEITASLPC